MLDATDIGAHAIDYALHGWPVFPCRGKVPAIPNPHPEGRTQRRSCKGECGFKATASSTPPPTSPDRRTGGAAATPGATSAAGSRVDGHDRHRPAPRRRSNHSPSWSSEHGPLPDTLTTTLGSRRRRQALFFRRPSGKLTDKRLGPGIDLKTSTGYVVLPPSIHPDTGKPYDRIEAPGGRTAGMADRAAAGPNGSRTETPITATPRSHGASPARRSPTSSHANTSWADDPRAARLAVPRRRPRRDGAALAAPHRHLACSATIRHGCLFVYSHEHPVRCHRAG